MTGAYILDLYDEAVLELRKRDNVRLHLESIVVHLRPALKAKLIRAFTEERLSSRQQEAESSGARVLLRWRVFHGYLLASGYSYEEIDIRARLPVGATVSVLKAAAVDPSTSVSPWVVARIAWVLGVPMSELVSEEYEIPKREGVLMAAEPREVESYGRAVDG